MLATDVIKHPILTEKSTFGMNERRQYTFAIDRRATKTDVQKAVEELYKVKVSKVNTQVRKGRAKQYRYGLVQGTSSKRAIVTLAEGQAIELF